MPKEKKNIPQIKSITYFEKLNIMDMMETLDKMKFILNQKIEEKRKQFNQELEQLNSMQEKILTQ